jgi:hypothetical protein
MSELRLEPAIPMVTPHGPGYAFILINDGAEHHLRWVVALDNNEIWEFQNPDVRMQGNITMHRAKPEPINPARPNI